MLRGWGSCGRRRWGWLPDGGGEGVATVILACAGVQKYPENAETCLDLWIPACAGMTGLYYATIPSMFPPPLAIPPQLSGKLRAALSFLAGHGGLLVCALFLLAGLNLAGDYGFGLDELHQRGIAQANGNYILNQVGIVPNGSIDPELYQDRYYGIAFELPLLLAEQALGLEDPYYIHRFRLTVIHLFFIIGAFFCYRLACRWLGSRLLALFALLIFLLHPRIYAHSFFNSKDLPFLSMFIIALYLLERAFRRDTPAAFLLLGIGVGLLTNLRIMGLLLVFAVIALRGLDWLQAGAGKERKRVLGMAGLFLLAAGLTWYAVTPYAWANPVGYLAATLSVTVDFPHPFPNLFQGEWLLPNELPPHYTVTWFGITTPPPLLLLGGIGAAAVVAAGFRRPRGLFRCPGGRWPGLLLACFLLPPLAVALLGSSQYNDWRHSYFLYVPFGLLAAGGLSWLTAAFAGRRPWRVGVYGLTAAGLGLALLQIIQLHPLQHLYFNFLVDRTTPEYLRTQYSMGYGELAWAAAAQRVLKSYPGETLVARTGHWWGFALLPPGDRARLRPHPGGKGQADYHLFDAPAADYAPPDAVFNAGYRRLYNNTIIDLRPLDSSRMADRAVAAYGEIYRQAVDGEPIIRADYNVYRQGQRLTFVKENCPADSRDAWFGAQPYPPEPPRRDGGNPFVAAATAPPGSFGNYGVRLGDTCLAVVQLPAAVGGDVVISQSNLGKVSAASLVWQELYSLSPPGLREYIARLREEQPPAASNAFAVFLDRMAGGGYRLLYAKENCAWAEYETLTFLHISPENRADLPFYLWAGGVDNREFLLRRYGVRALGGDCIAVFPLPDYPIASLLTGQAGAWAKNLYPPADPEALRATYAVLADIPPVVRSDFDLYIQDNRLIYRRERCAAADTAAGFFLHITPRDTAGAPAGRQRDGYVNRDFDFARWGGHFDGQCLAAVPLPEYPIAAIRTGQGDSWAASFYRPAAPDYLRAAYAALADIQPVVRSDFDLYLQDGRLVYLRESCAAGDTAAGFFLHIVPADAADLPAERQSAGFAPRGFAFARWGGHFDGKCLAAVPLPEYPIAAIRTGRRRPGPGDRWSVELIAAPDSDRLRAAYAALSARQPDARSEFDLYVQDNRLIYLRESCAAGDMAAGFFLHIIPGDVGDLPAARRAAGFANRDFAFNRYGGHFDGRCLATVPLPEYPIAAIRTGQFVAGQGELWAAEVAGDR